MKFTLTFKTPDVMDVLGERFSDEGEREEALTFASKFVRWSEYVDIEFDTNAQTARVLPSKERY